MTLLPSKLARLAVAVIVAGTFLLVLQLRLSEEQSAWLPRWSPAAALGQQGTPARSLAERLDALLSRPVVDAAGWRQANELACPSSMYEREQSFMHQGEWRAGWDQVSKDDVRAMRAAAVAHLRAVEQSGALDQDLRGRPSRGLLMTAGNGDSVKSAVVLLKLLRNTYRSTLPVEVFHYPDELTSAAERASLEDFADVELREVDAAHSVYKGYEIKPYAFIATSFTEFLYLDSDSLPVRDPADMFEAVEFTAAGGRSVWWADSFKLHPENAIWRVLGRPCSDALWSFETGQVLFDKHGNGGLNLAALHLVQFMITTSDSWRGLSWGDKDLFLFAFLLLDLPFAMAPRQHSGIARAHYVPGFRPCEHTMLHYGLTPRAHAADPAYHPLPAFAHLTRLKHSLGWFDKAEPLFVTVRRLSKDRLDEPLAGRMQRGHGGVCPFNTLWGADDANEGDDRLGDGQFIVAEPVAQAFGGALAAFEDDWRAAGGWD